MTRKLTLLGLFLTSLTFAQVTIDETVFVNSGAVFYSNAATTITTNGLLQVEGELVLDDEITGDDLLQLEPTASLTLNGGTVTLTHETNEAFADLTLGTAGFVEVPAGNSLTLTGNLDNQNTGQGLKLLAAADGSYGQLLTTGTITNKGNTYAEQFFSASANVGWRQFGSPVSASFTQVDDDFQTYYPNTLPSLNPGVTGTANQWNLKYWEATSAGSGTNPQANGWLTVDNNDVSFGPATAAVGYTIYTGGAFNILNNGILDLEGEVGNGDYTFFTYPTSATVEQTIEDIGWNLIPNPYPSNISVSTLLSDATNFGLAYEAIHIWDAINQEYIAVTDNAAINLAFTGVVLAESLVNIAPFQAFWIKGSTTVNESITLKNTHRTITNQGDYFKTAPQLIRLNATAANGDIDQTLLTFEEGASDELENRDAFKLRTINETKPSLFTTVQGKEISINRLAMPLPEKHVPMFLKDSEIREFTIDMVQSTVDLNWSIELEDHKKGVIHNLRERGYTFTNDPRFTSNRFTVHVNKTGESITSARNARIAIYDNDAAINVSFGYFATDVATADILITNLAGQTLYSGTVPTDQDFSLPVRGAMNMYVVHVIAGDKTEVGKVVR